MGVVVMSEGRDVVGGGAIEEVPDPAVGVLVDEVGAGGADGAGREQDQDGVDRPLRGVGMEVGVSVEVEVQVE